MKTFKEYINESYHPNPLDRVCTKIDNLLKNHIEVSNKYINYIIEYIDLNINKYKYNHLYNSMIWRFSHLFLDNGRVIPKEIVDRINNVNALDLILFGILQPQLAKRIPVELLPKLGEFQIKELKNFIHFNFKTEKELQEFLKANKWALEIMV